MKGLVPLLEAVAKLRTERDVELVVIGRPTEGGRVARTIERLGLAPVVRCVSGISDDELACMYAEAQVAVVPSLYEGFSLPGHRGHGVRRAPGGHHRRGPSRGGGDRRRDRPVGDARRPRGPGRRASGASSTTDALAGRLGEGGRRRVLGRFTWEATARGTAEQYRLRCSTPTRRRERSA